MTSVVADFLNIDVIHVQLNVACLYRFCLHLHDLLEVSLTILSLLMRCTRHVSKTRNGSCHGHEGEVPRGSTLEEGKADTQCLACLSRRTPHSARNVSYSSPPMNLTRRRMQLC